jgi:uncharacterized protein YdeI (YjbR/CyaY-like superfamily)
VVGCQSKAVEGTEGSRLAHAGRPRGRPDREDLRAAAVIPELPRYIASAIKADAAAWRFFRELSPRNRRDFVVWIHTAKRADTRERRMRESLALLAAGKKLGLK